MNLNFMLKRNYRLGSTVFIITILGLSVILSLLQHKVIQAMFTGISASLFVMLYKYQNMVEDYRKHIDNLFQMIDGYQEIIKTNDNKTTKYGHLVQSNDSNTGQVDVPKVSKKI